MSDLLDRAGVKRCTRDVNAPRPIQCGTGRAAACGCGNNPPCHFTIGQLVLAVGKLERNLPGNHTKRAALITEALQLKADIPKKGNVAGTAKNWPVVGFCIGGEDDPLEDPVRILDQLCNGEVAWVYEDDERQQLGSAVARADPRYVGQSERDIDAWESFHKVGYYYYEEDYREYPQVDYSGVTVLDEDTPDDGADEGPSVSSVVPYRKPVDEAELTATSQRQWTQQRAMFSAMPAGMPAEEQVRRVRLALNYSAATVYALTTWDSYSGQTVASMLSEVADAVGDGVLGDQLASGIILRAAHGARLVGVGNAEKSSALISMMMRVAKRVGVPQVEQALRTLTLVAPTAPAAAPGAPTAQAAAEPAAPDVPAAAAPAAAAPAAAAPAAPAPAAPTAPAPAAPTTPIAIGGAASSSITAPDAHIPRAGWTCQVCNQTNSVSDEVCTGRVGVQPCNTPRARGHEFGEGPNKRIRTSTNRLEVQAGAGQSYESGSGGAPPRSSGAGGGIRGSNAPARGRAAATTPAPPPAVPSPSAEDARSALTDAEDAKRTALAELDQLVGIADVKKKVTELCADVMHGLRERELTGAEPLSTNKHMLFLGNPGTGKTTVANIMARLLKGMGVVATDKVFIYDNARNALVDGNVGCTAGKAAKVINKAVGGVLFLDEARPPPAHIARRTLTCTCEHPSPSPSQAYTLIPGVGGHDYSQEAIDVLLSKSEEIRHDTVIILAGYSKDMATLLDCNQGLTSRFPTRVEFKDYSPTELVEISQRMAADLRMLLGPGVLELLRGQVLTATLPGNARDVRNLLEKTRSKRNTRVMGLRPTLDGPGAVELHQTATTADVEAAVADLPTFNINSR